MRKFWQSIQEVGMLSGDRDLRNLEGGRLSFLRVLRVGVTQGALESPILEQERGGLGGIFFRTTGGQSDKQHVSISGKGLCLPTLCDVRAIFPRL